MVARVCMLTWNIVAAVLKCLLCWHCSWNIWTIFFHEMDIDTYYVLWSLADPRHVLARWSTATTQDLSIINTLIIEWHVEDNPLVRMFTWFHGHWLFYVRMFKRWGLCFSITKCGKCEADNGKYVQHFIMSFYEKCDKRLLRSVLIFVHSQTQHMQDFCVLE